MVDPPLYYQLLAFATGFAHQAVVVFFLISGWLVGGSLLNRIGQPGALLSYAIDRATRLWTVLVPALCLMLASASSSRKPIRPAPTSAPRTNTRPPAFAGNLLGLQTVLVKNFGGNYALWSLANESWYYVQFPLLLLVFMARSRLRQAGAASRPGADRGRPAGRDHALLRPMAARRPVLAGAHRVRQRLARRAGPDRPGCSVYFRIHGSNDDLTFASFLQDLVYSLPLLVILASLQRPLLLRSPFSRGVAKLAHLLSEFSFTLYVTHIPHQAAALPGPAGIRPRPARRRRAHGLCRLLRDAAGRAGRCYLSYRLFEAHTFRLRRAIKNAVQRQPARPAIASASAE
jgi:peptidoglycan/LPS O-acetylase OafA/YrhL